LGVRPEEGEAYAKGRRSNDKEQNNSGVHRPLYLELEPTFQQTQLGSLCDVSVRLFKCLFRKPTFTSGRQGKSTSNLQLSTCNLQRFLTIQLCWRPAVATFATIA
jgi:hypothetical protein